MKKLIALILPILIFSCQPINPSNEDNDNGATVQLYELFAEDKDYKKEEPEEGKMPERIWREVSEEAEKEDAAFYQSLLDRLEKIDRAALTRSDQINYDMFDFILKDRIAQVEFETYLTPISADGGFHISFVYMVDNLPFGSEEDYKKYIQRLEEFKNYTQQNIAMMRKGLAAGKTLPKVVLNGYETSIDPHIVTNVEESLFYKPFTKMPGSIAADVQESLIIKGKEALQKSVIPAFKEFSTFMKEEYIPGAVDAIGVSAQPQGEDYYQQRVQYFTTLDYSANEIFEIGEKEVARIKADMMEVIEEVGFQGSFAEFLNFLRTDPQFYAKTPRELLMQASYFSKKIDGKLPTYFNDLPRLSYGVAPVPDAIAPKYTTGRYIPGSYDDHRAGFYWVNTFKLKSRPLYVLPALTLHEAVPGHHLQMSMAAEMDGVPDFRRQTYLSCYGEGWALYCEWLGEEAGMYETPYERFGRMTYEMWRACRLVVDVGIHIKGWTREEAVNFMASNTALSIHEVNTEIDRYIGWPGQALSYKIGELKIRELRKKVEKALGDKFDIRTFHDVILRNGSVPLFVLEELVDEYLESFIE